MTLHDTVTVVGDNASGTSSRAVWNEFSYMYDETNSQVVQYSTSDWRSTAAVAELINCCGTAGRHQLRPSMCPASDTSGRSAPRR